MALISIGHVSVVINSNNNYESNRRNFIFRTLLSSTASIVFLANIFIAIKFLT